MLIHIVDSKCYLLFHFPFAGYHVIQTKSQLSVLGMGKVKNVKPLSEKAAIDLGANIVGDIVMILCALGIYYLFEKSGPSSTSKEEELRAEEIQILKETVVHQSVELERQADKLKVFERILGGDTIYSKMSERVMAEMTENKKIQTKT